MAAARMWLMVGAIGGVACLCGSAPAAFGSEHDASRVRVRLEVTGNAFAAAEGEAEPTRAPISVSAALDFHESAADATAIPQAVLVRDFAEASAEITVDGRSTRLKLGDDARRVAVARLGTTPVPFLTEGFLTRDEFDVLETPFDSLLLDGLRPSDPVAVGDTWQVSGDLTAGLLAIDRIESGGLEAKLVEATDGTAKAAITGVIDGAIDGVPTHLVVEGTFAVPAREEDDGRQLLDGGVSRVDVVIRERRQPSHVAPGFDLEARLELERSAGVDAGDRGADTDDDDDFAARVSTLRRRGAGEPGTLWYRAGDGRYDLVYDAGWRTIEEGDTGLVLRLVDHGALVAQCSITALPRAAADVTPSVDEVKRDIEKSLSGQFTRFESAAASEQSNGPDGGTLNVVRVASAGTAEGLPFRWIHYVVSDAEGRRASVTFMLEASLVERFADADRELVAGLRLEPEGVREARLPEKTALP